MISGRQDLCSAPPIGGCINKQDLKDGNDADMRRRKDGLSELCVAISPRFEFGEKLLICNTGEVGG